MTNKKEWWGLVLFYVIDDALRGGYLSLRTLRLLWPFVKSFIMPRGPRLDAPGVLRHVMARGIMRQAIFRDDSDRNDFIACHTSRITPIG